jgi:hypothetical protein
LLLTLQDIASQYFSRPGASGKSRVAYESPDKVNRAAGTLKS